LRSALAGQPIAANQSAAAPVTAAKSFNLVSVPRLFLYAVMWNSGSATPASFSLAILNLAVMEAR